jgi:hypothetical protein
MKKTNQLESVLLSIALPGLSQVLCLYMFSMWDAYKDADGRKESFSFLPFVFSAHFITVGLIFSPTLRIMGILFRPVWLQMLFLIIGLFITTFFKTIFQKTIRFNTI